MAKINVEARPEIRTQQRNFNVTIPPSKTAGLTEYIVKQCSRYKIKYIVQQPKKIGYGRSVVEFVLIGHKKKTQDVLDNIEANVLHNNGTITEES